MPDSAHFTKRYAMSAQEKDAKLHSLGISMYIAKAQAGIGASLAYRSLHVIEKQGRIVVMS